MPPTYVALDLETTGLDAERDDIIEIAAVRFTPGQVLETYSTLVRPRVALPRRVTDLTGLTLDDLADAPRIGAVLDDFAEFVGHDPVVAHSVGQDLKFLRRHGVLKGSVGYDTFQLASILLPKAPRYGVRHLVEHLGLASDGRHRALADAQAHRRLFEALLERIERLDPGLQSNLARLTRGSDWPLAPLFQRFEGNAGDHTAGTGGSAAVAEETEAYSRGAHLDGAAPVPIDADGLEARIAPGGSLAAAFDRFEDRPGQRRMLRLVAEAFNRGDHLLVEAGTGTGKSLAYLLPSAAWSQANDQPVVISTHTIALQTQLLTHDIPMVQRLLDAELRVAVLKGRGHYLCRSRLASLANRTDLDADTLVTVAKILVWSEVTETGDRSELLLTNDEMPTWRRVAAEGDACSGSRCPYARKGDCWVHRARRRAESAHLVIVNHALLVSDILVKNRLLPTHRRLIVDEAHHLEDVASASLGATAGQRSVKARLDEICSGDASVLARVRRAVPLSGLAADEAETVRERVDSLDDECHAARKDAKRLFKRISGFLSEHAGQGSNARLTSATRHGPGWMEVEAAWDPLRDRLGQLRDGLNRLMSVAAVLDGPHADPGLAADLAAAQRDVADIFDVLERVISAPRGDDITWASRGGRERMALHRAPLRVGDYLDRRLFGDKETVVLTSATLRASDDFELIKDQLGLRHAESTVVPSPFDYSQSALLIVPRDMPEPSSREHPRVVERCIVDLAAALKGRTLVLFTSHADLRAAYHAVRGPLGNLDISVLGQGMDGSRSNILEGFRDTDTRTVLLGTKSFWEGVDVPGEALTGLIIVRLPFDVPTDPVFAARSETFEEPFYDYAVPQAILRFRQGFGRLIRSTEDRGVVVVLDPRILTKRYGSAFVEALPPVARRIAPVDSVAAVAARFLAGEPVADADGPWGMIGPQDWYNAPAAGTRGQDLGPEGDEWRG